MINNINVTIAVREIIIIKEKEGYVLISDIRNFFDVNNIYQEIKTDRDVANVGVRVD